MKPQLTRHIVETMIQDAFVYRLLNRNLSLPAISKCFLREKNSVTQDHGVSTTCANLQVCFYIVLAIANDFY